jgi:multisubunit Na+/H+ antiporter MnhC subunit
MAPAHWFAALIFAAAIALLAIGAVTAWAGANAAKRVVGCIVALFGAALALAALGAPAAFVLTAVVLSFAYLALGAGIVVRLQEAYGGVETTEIDSADRKADAEQPQ